MSVESITDFFQINMCTCGIPDYVASLCLLLWILCRRAYQILAKDTECVNIIEYKVKSSIIKLDSIHDKVLSKLNVCPNILNRVE